MPMLPLMCCCNCCLLLETSAAVPDVTITCVVAGHRCSCSTGAVSCCRRQTCCSVATVVYKASAVAIYARVRKHDYQVIGFPTCSTVRGDCGCCICCCRPPANLLTW